MWKAIAFIIGTLALVYISRASLRSPRSHGFYRFFAWDCILLLFLLNADVWFLNPFSWHQLISWIMLFVSFVLLIFGVRALRSSGKSVERRAEEASLFAFEKTSQLVTTGIYAYIRHPLYSSLLLLAWGIFFKAPNLTGGMIALVATTFLIATAIVDEAECIRFFGDNYQQYMKKTKRFIPFLF